MYCGEYVPKKSLSLTVTSSGLGANGYIVSQRSNPNGPEPTKSCSASSVDPGGWKFAHATFSVFPDDTAAAASRSSTAASIIVTVAPPDCPVEARRLASTSECDARTSRLR